MTLCFADTGYWIALLSENDSIHQRAIEVTNGLQPLSITTTELVVIEVLDGLSTRGERQRLAGALFYSSIVTDPNISIVPTSSELVSDAFDLWQKRLDKQWTLTDCVSFIVMAERNIVSALAYDHHFAQAGFHALLRDS